MATLRLHGIKPHTYKNFPLQKKIPDARNGDFLFDGEGIREIKKDFDAFLDAKVSDALYKYHKAKGEPLDLFTIPLFQDTIKKIIHLDCAVEIIGRWIYCFKAGKVKSELEQNGFWYSSKFRAWIFSGKKKRRYATKAKLSDLRNGNYR